MRKSFTLPCFAIAWLLFLACGGEEPPKKQGPKEEEPEAIGTWSQVDDQLEFVGAPITGVFTGTKALFWKGCYGEPCTDGASYDAERRTWARIGREGAPASRDVPSTVWTGKEMILFGGILVSGDAAADGGRYDPETDGWAPLPSAPAGRWGHSALWTGSEMIVWGGIEGEEPVGSGLAYDPSTDAWRELNRGGAPSARLRHVAVWTGSEMIVWGGESLVGSGMGRESIPLGDGASYDPVSDRWEPLPSEGAPSPRWASAAVWTGKELLLWGGIGCSHGNGVCDDGFRFDPANRRWSQIRSNPSLGARTGHSLVWTGSQAILWGGIDWKGPDAPFTNHGGSYDPASGRWTPVSTVRAPSPRSGHAAFWTGGAMLVWGGQDGVDGEIEALGGGLFTP